MEELLGSAAIGPADPKLAAMLAAPGLLQASPPTPELAAEALRVCAESEAAAIPVGAGSKLARGRLPRKANVLLSTAALDQVSDHQPADLTVSTQTGVPLARLQAELGAAGQFLAVDPPWGDVATLGGLVASGAEGPLRRRYGALRDQLLGLRVANPDGTLTWAGGHVVKNVSGYDLTRLHTGAYGTLGVITDVNLKVWPQPEAELTVLGTGTNPLPLLERLAVAPFWPLAADVFLGRAAARRGGAGPGQFLLALRFGGRASANARGQSDAVALLSGAGSPDPQVLAGADSVEFWKNAAALQPECQATGFAVAAIALPARQRIELLQAGLARWRKAEIEFSGWGRTEHGWFHVALAGSTGPRALAGELGWLRQQCTAGRGACVFEHLPDQLAGQLDPWGPADPVAQAAMERLKMALDPRAVISPGRYLGGI
ncbi:MAG: FAD-binding oxidoreductase [Chloroflexi bacterium]|nr:FAD-binding oxidoreductase [Chloroflexota bacterium]